MAAGRLFSEGIGPTNDVQFSEIRLLPKATGSGRCGVEITLTQSGRQRRRYPECRKGNED